MSAVIKVENLSKQYRLGTIGTGTLSHDFNRWWYRVRGKEDPYLKIGEVNDRTQKSGTDDYVWALKDINFEVKQGEVLGIIGRNGAGKSTLLKILSRTTLPTTGSVKVKGRIASLLEVGTGFHPELTGRENIFLNGAILGMRKAEIKNKFDEIVDFAGVEKYIDTPVKRYSSGMYVRLAFAVAAHMEPEILVVDEVLAVGDAEFQKKAIGKMKDVSGIGGRTVLFVSHNMGALRDLCDTAIFLSNGTLQQKGTAREMIASYLEKNRLSTLSVAIRERTDRGGSGRITLTGLKFIDPISGRNVDSVVAGDGLIIEMDYEASKSDDYTIAELVFGITVNNRDEVFVSPLNNKMSKEAFLKAPSKGTVSCLIPRVSLMSGIFYLDVGVLADGIQADLVKNACSLHVHEGDYYGTGTKNSGYRQGVYIEQSWSLK